MEEFTLSEIYKTKKTDRDIFHELMVFQIKEILLVATYYDAYTIVGESQFSDKILGEYLQLNLYAAPRVTSVSTYKDAFKKLNAQHFDLVILMAGVEKESPIYLSEKINEHYPEIPILLLANINNDLAFFYKAAEKIRSIDKVFVWNGDPKVFMAMIKYIEDKINVEKDTKIGYVRVILLVENSAKYYSRYLPLLYTIIMSQTQDVIAVGVIDELHKILKMRVRPKVLFVTTYEEAVEIVDKYLDNLLCVISDVKYKKNGVLDEDAGVELIKYVRSLNPTIPALLQSHDIVNAEKAVEIGSNFIYKNSDSLSLDITNFFYDRLGFGDFVFTDARGKKVGVAKTLIEFEELLKTIPDELLLHHAKKNNFSTWLMARGEIILANSLKQYSVDDFETVQQMRELCINVFNTVRKEKRRGVINKFHPAIVNSNSYIVRLGGGSSGGKGRGLSFLSNFIENTDFPKIISGLNISIPPTSFIGVFEFDKFFENNNLHKKIYIEKNYDKIKELFINANISDKLSKQLYEYLKVMKKPLAIRSSGLLEDSLLQAFSGVYSTYFITNNHPDIKVRHEQLVKAIKLVYASVFFPSARAYFDAVNCKLEEEKMAVIIQEVVGNKYGEKYYPHISGVAQSYNFYPFLHLKPEDGIVLVAVGFGMYVVGGEKTHRFSPKFPQLEIYSLKDKVKNTQTNFYAIDLNNTEPDFINDGKEAAIVKLDINEAEKYGNLKHCASVYDPTNERIVQDLNLKGPRVIDFANILKHEYIPLAKSLQSLLQIFQEALGSAVEIEFAVDLNKGENGLPTLYLLQIKPIVSQDNTIDIDKNSIDRDKLLLFSNRGMGNGKLSHIKDVIFIDIDEFDRTKTEEMAEEAELLNNIMEKKNKEYILIGPGRWGTRDKYIGIPVIWPQISRAKVIIEMGLKDFPLDDSLGSHFFHNITSRKVGYFSVQHHSPDDYLNLNILNKQKVVNKTQYFKHVEFNKPLTVLMDGKKRVSVITFEK
ncbi:MAG: PEP/pyruvate-binding domain-containing protein [Bacteroidota bacterium]